MSGNRRMLGGRIHIGCIIAVVLVIIAGCISLPYLTRSGTALMLEQTAETLSNELKLPPQEKEAVTEKFNTLAQKVRDGEVDLKQLESLSKLLADGPLPTIVMARVVETRYLEASGLPEEEKQAGITTLTRFAHGVIIGLITPDEADAIEEIMFEIPADSEAKEESDAGEATSYRDKKLKESMTDEDLAKLLGDMKTAADKFGVAEDVAKPDIAHVIQVAIDKVITKPQPPVSTN